jgi:hypothetical protein
MTAVGRKTRNGPTTLRPGALVANNFQLPERPRDSSRYRPEAYAILVTHHDSDGALPYRISLAQAAKGIEMVYRISWNTAHYRLLLEFLNFPSFSYHIAESPKPL